MYNNIQLAIKYIQYYATAYSGKGHQIHSPFIFNFVTQVLNDNRSFYAFTTIEQQRKQLLHNNTLITVEDFGAGSRTNPYCQRTVAAIAKSSLKPKKFGQLFFKMAHYYNPQVVVELGTSLGISTAYFAASNPHTQVYTFEGATAVAAMAQHNFTAMAFTNIHTIIGNFNTTLAPQLQMLHTIDMAYIDGNHRYIPTIQYFQQLLQKCTEHSVIIMDDIHWSKEMEQAWHWVQQHAAVTATVDLFYVGIIFLRKEIKHKQHFVIRY